MNRVRTLTIVFVLILAAVGGGTAVIAAQEAPGEPANFYGEAVDENGNDAPVGTTIVAVVDGTVEGEITVDDAGEYGGEGGLEEKLALDSSAGDEVSFHVDSSTGPEAVESPVDLESGTFEQDLTFPGSTFDEEAELESVDLELDTTEIGEGDTTEATVTADYDDGSNEDVTDNADIDSNDVSIATVDGTTITGEDSGTTDIEAEFGGVTDTVELTVTEDDDDDGNGNGNGGGGGGGGGSAPSDDGTDETSDDPTDDDEGDSDDIDAPVDEEDSDDADAPVDEDDDTSDSEEDMPTEDTADDIEESDDDSIPGFGAAIMIVALLSTALIAAQRRS